MVVVGNRSFFVIRAIMKITALWGLAMRGVLTILVSLKGGLRLLVWLLIMCAFSPLVLARGTVNAPGVPTLWESHNQHGQLAYKEGNYKLAEEKFLQALTQAEKARAAKRRLASVLTNLGACCREQGRYTAAEQYFERALEVGKDADPETKAMILRHYGGLLHKTQRLGAATYVAEPGIMRRWDEQSRKRELVANPLVIRDGWRSAYIENGRLVKVSDMYNQARAYRRSGHIVAAKAVEDKVHKLFGNSYEPVWLAQAARERRQIVATVQAQIIQAKATAKAGQILKWHQQVQENARKKMEETLARVRELEEVSAPSTRVDERPDGALVQINVMPGSDFKLRHSAAVSPLWVVYK